MIPTIKRGWHYEFYICIADVTRSGLVLTSVQMMFQNNNLERALDWIFTHPEEEESDALSDMADTEPNDNAFSNANSHSDSTLSPDRDMTGPRVKDGPGRE